MNEHQRRDVLEAALGHIESASGASTLDEGLTHLTQAAAWMRRLPELGAVTERVESVRDLAGSGRIELGNLDHYILELRDALVVEHKMHSKRTGGEPISFKPILPIGVLALGSLVAWTIAFPMLLEGGELPIWKPLTGTGSFLLVGCLGALFTVKGVAKLPQSESGLTVSLGCVGLYVASMVWAGSNVAEWTMSGEAWIVWKLVIGALAALLGLTALASFCRLLLLYAKNEKQKSAARKARNRAG